jgi:glycosyltransferase involved in cell wall biosynthesis
VFTHDDISYKIVNNKSSIAQSFSGDKPIIPKRKSSVRLKLSSKVRMLAKNSKILSAIYLYKEYAKINKLITYYIKLNRNPDVVQFHSDMECYIFLKKRKNAKPKTIMFLHTDGIPLTMTLCYFPCIENSWIHRKLLKVQKYAVDNVDQCVFISKIGRDNFLKFYPEIPLSKTAIVINGIEDFTDTEKENMDKAITPFSNLKYRLCCTGTINLRKGHKIILEALTKIKKELLANIYVTFIGEGPERMELEKYVENNNLSNHVAFMGMIENSLVYKYLCQNNIYILMSKSEGLPISIIEAMRAGLPIISTRIAGIPELINEGVNGFLLDPEVAQLVGLLNRIEEYDWSEMGENSRKRFLNEFTFERMRSEYCDILDTIR